MTMTDTETRTLHVPGREPLSWRPADALSLARAHEAFASALRAGMAAFATTETSGYTGEQVREFTPDAAEIRMTAPFAGG